MLKLQNCEKFFLLLLVTFHSWTSTIALSNLRRCADPNCQSVISIGRGTINYNAGERGMVSFKINSKINVKSKSAGNDPSLWGIEVNGRQGYAPKEFIQESRILISDQKLEYVVPVLLTDDVSIGSSILNASEASITQDNIGSTTTAPLDSLRDKNNLLDFKGNIIEQSPPSPTPLHKVEEVVDGTRIPIEEDGNIHSISSKELVSNMNHESTQISDQMDTEPSEVYDEIDGYVDELDDDEDAVSKLTTKTEKNLESDIADFNSPVSLNLDSKPNANLHLERNEIKSADSDLLIQFKEQVPLTTTESVLKVEETRNIIKDNKIIESKNEMKSHEVVQQPIVKSNLASEGKNEVKNIITSSSKIDNELSGNSENEDRKTLKINVNDSTDKQLKNEQVSQIKNKETEESRNAQGIRVNENNVEVLTAPYFTESGHSSSFDTIIDEITTLPSIVMLKTVNYNDVEMSYGMDLSTEDVKEDTNPDILANSVSNIQTSDSHKVSESEIKMEEVKPADSVLEELIPNILNSTSHADQVLEHTYKNSDTLHDQHSTQTPAQSLLNNKDELSLLGSVTDQQSNIDSGTQDITNKLDDFGLSNLQNNERNLDDLGNEISSASSLEIQPDQTPKPLQLEKPKDQGLFATILGSVNNIITSGKKEIVNKENLKLPEENELNRILLTEHTVSQTFEDDMSYCEKLSSNDCPKSELKHQWNSLTKTMNCQIASFSEMTYENLVDILFTKLLEMSDLLACLAIVSVSMLLFVFGYYCFCNSSREGGLLAKVNTLERSLLAYQKENAILKDDLGQTRNKLTSIEDYSFGTDDVVIGLKNDLEEEILMKQKLQEQVTHLEKELESAAEAGLELNKIVSELLSNQTGDVSIISSVEELQKQLNQQQNTILEINSILAEKSRQNSELQVMLSEQTARLKGELSILQQENDELEIEKGNLQTRLEEIKNEFEEDMKAALESKNFEIKRLQNEMLAMRTKMDEEHSKFRTTLAKVEALEDCLKTVKRDPSVNITEVINVTNIRAELLDIQRKYNEIKEELDVESDGKKVLESQLQVAISQMEKYKHDFNQSETDKLEAQTRLEVLSNYFKEKEMQLQKELSLKEAMWLKQQGETVSTVDRVTAMQEEISSLKSQNDSLRAEIEAQLAAHKAQTGTLENRAHETWLAARQTERRYEEARAEATALRRKLTSLMGGNIAEVNRPTNSVMDVKISDSTTAPSPINMEQPNSPMLGRMPPPPFLPPPFIPPFMGIPPHFVPTPGDMRPPPLGRIMSPPLPLGSGSRSTHSRPVRYSPDMLYYEETYDDDDDVPQRRRRNGGPWHRDSYSPPRSYRSHSPADSRYNYTDRDLMSTIDTETDISPPASPRRSRGSHSGSLRAYSPPLTASSPIDDYGHGNSNASGGNKKQWPSKSNKGSLSSGSDSSHRKKSKVKSMV